MGLAALRPGQKLSLNGVRYELIGLLPSGNWQMAEADSGLREDKPPAELWQAFVNGRLRFISDRDGTPGDTTLLSHLREAAVETPHSCSDADLKEASCRLKYVQQVDKLRRFLSLKDIIHETWEKLHWPELEPTTRTVELWLVKVRNASDPARALVKRTFKKGNRKQRYPIEVVELADEIVRSKYLQCKTRLTIAGAVEKLADAVDRENALRPASEHLPIPGRRLVESRVALVPERERIAKRYGSDAAMAAMRTSLGGTKTTRALERAEIDHTLLAIVLLDEDFMPWGRASSSLCLDAHTRAVTGFCNSAEVPSIVSLARCMTCSVLPKSELLKKFPEVKFTWDCFGVHESYVVDNGLEEHATALRHAASELGGSTIEFCPRKAPWFKPHVERHFRRQDVDLLQTLPGCTGENITARPAFNPKKDLLLRRSTFHLVYMLWLLGVYMRKPQAALGDISPAEAWKRSITLEDQFVPTRRTLLERLFLRKISDRVLDHEGIQYDCLIYNSGDMGALRTQLGSKLSVDIWVSDEDLGYIYVEVPRQDISIRVPCLDQSYASGLTRWQHEKCKDMRRVRRAEGLQLCLREVRDEIERLVLMDLSELRQARRKIRSRFTEHPPQVPAESNLEEEAQTPSISDGALMRDEDRALPVLPQTTVR